MLHGLLQEIDNPCSFKFFMIGFNSSLTLGFSVYCFDVEIGEGWKQQEQHFVLNPQFLHQPTL